MADTTPRGYPYPEGTDVWRASADDDGGAPWRNLAEAVDADVAAVEAAAGGATAGVADDLADHAADTTGVHGIADTSALVTTARQITAGTGLTGGGTLAADRTIGIAAGGVGTTELANDAVTSAKIADGTIATADIANGAVTDAKLAGSISPSKVTGTAVVEARQVIAGTGLTGGGTLAADRTISIAAGGVGTTQLADDAVTTGKIAAGAVGTSDIADSAVTSAKIADGTIVNGDVNAAAAIDPSKIAGTAVVQARTVTGVNSLTGGGDLSANRTLDVADGGIGTAELANGAVTTAKIAAGAITIDKVDSAAGFVAAATVGNMVKLNAATGTDALGDTTDISVSGGTPESSTAYAYRGSRSVKVTATGTGLSWRIIPTTARVPVTEGLTYTAFAYGMSPDSTVGFRMTISWHDAGGTLISSTFGQSAALSSDWKKFVASGMAPTGAVSAFANLVRTSTDVTLGHTVYFDHALFHRGVGGAWSPPGMAPSGEQPAAYIAESSTNLTLDATTSHLLATGTMTATLPKAADHAGRAFTLSNSGAGTLTVARTSPDVIDGSLTSFTVTGAATIEVVSDGTGWRIQSGHYTSATGNLASASQIDPAKVAGTAVVQARTITAGTGLTGGGTLAADQTIGIAAGGVGTTQLADAAVTPAKIAGYIDVRSSAISLTSATPVIRATGALTATLPAAASNTGRRFTLNNDGTGTLTIVRSGSDVISGSLTSVTIPGAGTVEIISDGVGWRILAGEYTTNTVGLATYRWNPLAPGWRLVAYDSGWRDVADLLVNGWAVASIDGRVEVQRTLRHLALVVNVSAANRTSLDVMTLPAGFRPLRNIYQLPGGEGLGGVALPAYISTGGVFSIGKSTTATSIYYAVTVPAFTTLPTSLPGTQVAPPA